MSVTKNYLSTLAEVTISVAGTVVAMHDLLTAEDITATPATGRGFGGRGPTAPPRTSFAFTVLPHSYRAFSLR